MPNEDFKLTSLFSLQRGKQIILNFKSTARLGVGIVLV